MFFYKRKLRKAKEAHAKIGYPAFSKEEQFKMIFHEDFQPIIDLTKYKFVSGDILNNYINIDLKDFVEYIKNNKNILFQKYNINRSGIKYGFWIKKISNGYKVLHKERGEIVLGFDFNNEDELITFYAKLFLSGIQKYSHLNPV